MVIFHSYVKLPESSNLLFDLLRSFAAVVARPLRATHQTTGWWYNYPSEKYESQWEGWHPTYYGICGKWRLLLCSSKKLHPRQGKSAQVAHKHQAHQASNKQLIRSSQVLQSDLNSPTFWSESGKLSSQNLVHFAWGKNHLTHGKLSNNRSFAQASAITWRSRATVSANILSLLGPEVKQRVSKKIIQR